MPWFVRSVMAVLAGCFAAFFHIKAIESLGLLIYPRPDGLDPARPETIVAYLKVIPTGAMLMVLLAWDLGTFAGSWLTARLAHEPKRNHGLVVGTLFLFAAWANLASLPHPTWFWAASLSTIPLMSFLGATVGSRKTRPLPVPAPVGGLDS
ncbi:hypothetical protein P12x_001684 [Tundrisphaera lichenicola]|uniref:hypothetical protein n=1 Tax=Tundrisphaera lichenicola TaxID=2029860 RepID=UPI003EC0BD93